MIKAHNLKKIYRDRAVPTIALDGVSFSIEQGEFVSIMGPSGSGKSTLMHIMGFLDRPSSGSYKFRGESIDSLSDDELARLRNKKMGFVFQTFNLLPKVSALDNVKLPLTYTGLSTKKMEEMAQEALTSVGLENRMDHLPNQLSGGEQQRVAIARAIVNHPSIIFADEPTGNLASQSGQRVMSIFQNLNDQDHTIILVTHERYTSEMAKRIIHLKDGKVIEDIEVTKRRFAKDGFEK